MKKQNKRVTAYNLGYQEGYQKAKEDFEKMIDRLKRESTDDEGYIGIERDAICNYLIKQLKELNAEEKDGY